MKLEIELVPSSCWYSNVRSNVPSSIWDIIRKKVYEDASHKCEICGRKGRLECHEIWNYDDVHYIQKLTKMIALCSDCHSAKHIGLARIRGKYEKTTKHLSKINKISIEDVALYIEVQFEIWSKRSAHKWTLDISALDNYTNKGEA